VSPLLVLDLILLAIDTGAVLGLAARIYLDRVGW
jgi:hypothetical protein